MSVLESVLMKVENSKEFPVIVTNKEFPIIEVASTVSKILEDNGYKVETFSNLETGIYGFKVNK